LVEIINVISLVINRWNMLDQQIIEATGLNISKNGLQKLRMPKMGFLMD